MTRDEILNMPAGREMDALVAEKVMGWKDVIMGRDDYGGEPVPREYNPRPEYQDEYVIFKHVLNYSTDIAAAWQVVEKVDLMIIPIAVYSSAAAWDEPKILPIKTWWAALRTFSDPSIFLPIEEYDKEWKGWVNLIDQSITLDMVAETAPLAICRAALLAVMEDKDDE
jgi:hypothetical protein